MDTLKKLTIELPGILETELKTLTSFNEKNPLLPIPSTEWKPLVKAGDYGKNGKDSINLPPSHLSSFVENWKNNVIGRPIYFNYGHKSKEAALWITDLRGIEEIVNSITGKSEPSALQYLPTYTPTGFQKIIGQDYRFVSIEYYDDYQGYGPTLSGAACTNDPFLVKDALVELENKNNNNKEAVTIMEIKELENKIDEQNKTLLEVNNTIKELQAANLKLQEEKVKELEAKNLEILKGKVEIKKLEWIRDGVPVPAIELAEKDPQQLELYDKIFKVLPKVPLSQEGPGQTKELNEKDAEEKLYLDEVKKANEIQLAKRGGKR